MINSIAPPFINELQPHKPLLGYGKRGLIIPETIALGQRF